MTTFKDYSQYYNLLYKDKDYKSEVDYVENLIKKYALKPTSSILDVGCGTGNHLAHLIGRGYELSGIDMSSEMISIAEKRLSNEKNVSLHCSNAVDFNLGRKFDAVVSLFHVVSYQSDNESLKRVFKNIYKHLNDNGLFVFDFWYGPAVLKDLPQTRVKRLENDDLKLTRIAEPFIDENNNIVTVSYTMLIEERKDGSLHTIKEDHRMRYLFYPELALFLESAGFEIIENLEWLSLSNHLNWRNWNGLIVSKKK